MTHTPWNKKEVPQTQPINPFMVPSGLEKLYKDEPEPTELDTYKRLQGQGKEDLAYDLFRMATNGLSESNPNRYREQLESYTDYASRPEFMDYVRHVIKLERIAAKLKVEALAKQKAEEQAKYNIDHACPVCSEVDYYNDKHTPCQKCQKVINTKLIHNKERDRMVDAWLKRSGGQVVRLRDKL